MGEIQKTHETHETKQDKRDNRDISQPNISPNVSRSQNITEGNYQHNLISQASQNNNQNSQINQINQNRTVDLLSSCEIKNTASIRNTEDGNEGTEDLESYMMQNKMLRDIILEKDSEVLKISKELERRELEKIRLSKELESIRTSVEKEKTDKPDKADKQEKSVIKKTIPIDVIIT